MKSTLLLSAPTAKLQIGNQVTATIDTSSSNGKKSYQINIVTQDDTLNQNIEETIEEVKNEIMNVKDEMADNQHEYHTEVREIQEPPFYKILDKAVPILFFMFLFAYLSNKSYQKRRWMETLLNKGVSPEEIKNLTKSKDNFIPEDKNLLSYDKQRIMKLSIIFGSLGLAILLGTIMDGPGYFFGFLFLFLGSGFWYYNNRVN